MKTIPFVFPVPGRWGLILRFPSPSLGGVDAVLTKPDGSSTVKDVCTMAEAKGARLTALADVGLIRVEVGAHSVEFADPDIHPDHLFDARRA